MLENIRIASPCSAKWEQMPGDDRIRHCEACNLNVYNFTAFTEQEIRDLLANRQGRLCVRLYQRSDGTVLMQNCPIRLRAVARRISRIAGAIFSFLVPNFIGAPVFAQSYTRMNVSDSAFPSMSRNRLAAPFRMLRQACVNLPTSPTSMRSKLLQTRMGD
jgi:hypothetical protein